MSLADKFNIPKSLHDAVRSIMAEETEYQAKVKALMAKMGIKSLNDLSPEEKKKFFSKLDSMHTSDAEKGEVKESTLPFTPDKPKKNPGVVPGKHGAGPSVAKHLAKMALKKQMDKKKSMKEEQELTESHFKVGDKVECIASGMKGEVVKLDTPEEGKYYTVKREDGKMMKYAPDELKKVSEMSEASSPAQQAAIAIAMKKAGKTPKDMKEAEGGGTSVKGNEADRAKATAERAKLTMQAAQLRIKQAKEREAISKKKQAIKSEFDPLEESFSDAQIAKLKQEYSKINTIDPSGENYKKLVAMLDKLDKPSLEKLAGASIKFVSGLARNRVSRMKNEELSPKQKALDKNKNGKIDGSDLAKLRNEEDYPEFKQGGPELAKKFNKSFKALGVNAKVKIKTVGNVSVNEEGVTEAAKSGTGYDLYHKDFSSAMAHAYDWAKKKLGVEVDPDEIDRNVAMGPRKPSVGKTNSYRLKGKGGAIQVQVYNTGKSYELNIYKEDIDVMFSEAMKKEKKEATTKDNNNKVVKSGDKLSGKQEPIELQPELKEDKK